MCCDRLSKTLLSKCSQRVLMTINLLACTLMLVCIALRFYYLSIGMTQGNQVAFFVVLAVYQVIFIALLVAAEFKMERPRLYFGFLDNKFGRGGLIVFTELLIIGGTDAIIIILGIVVLVIGVFGMVVGWSQGPDGKNAGVPAQAPKQSKKDNEPAAPSSQKQNPGIEIQDMAKIATNYAMKQFQSSNSPPVR